MRSSVSTALLLAFLLVASTSEICSQTFSMPNVTGTSMVDIHEAGGVLLEALELYNNEIVHLEYDIVYQGMVTTNFRQLADQWDYTICAFADFRVIDLDLAVYRFVDPDWVLVGRDQLRDKFPLVKIPAGNGGLFRYELTVYSFEEEYTSAHYGLLIYHDHPAVADPQQPAAGSTLR